MYKLVLSTLSMGIALCCSPTATAETENCFNDWVCIYQEEIPGGIEVYAENLRPFPITLSYRFKTDNLARIASAPTTLTLPIREKVSIARYRKLSGGNPVRLEPYVDWAAGRLETEHDDSYRYRLPYESDRAYSILQGYHGRFSHDGDESYTLDFNMRVGTPVHAAREGIVVDVVEHNDRGGWDPSYGRYANYIVIGHDDGTTGEYYHLKKDGAFVAIGDRVEKGQLIGLSGNTGHTALPHLHFGVYRPGAWGRTISVRVSFQTRDGVVHNPRRGRRYFVE